MSLTALDRTPALIVIDLQKGTAHSRLAVRPITAAPLPSFATVVDNSCRLAAEFRARRLPVVLVNAAGGAPGRTDARNRRRHPRTRQDDWTELLDDLAHHDSDLRITKHTWGAFQGTGLARILAERAVTQVVLAGVATSIGVESTARCAHERGLHVVLATDAMTDASPDAHNNSLKRIFPRLGETASTDDIIDKFRTTHTK
jgi:nicotinamidase-related amidase